MDKIENRLGIILQVITLSLGIIGNILIFLNQLKFIYFFANNDIGKTSIIVIFFLWILIISILKDQYLSLANWTNSLKKIILFNSFLVLLFSIYLFSPQIIKIPYLINFIQFFSYVIFWIIVFLFLSNSIIISFKNAGFKERKNNYPQTILETIKRYGAIYTIKNLRILGSYNIQPQDINEQNPWINKNLFTIDNFLTDNSKYWWVKSDNEGLQIYFTLEIKKEDYEKFVNFFKNNHPFLTNTNLQ